MFKYQVLNFSGEDDSKIKEAKEKLGEFMDFPSIVKKIWQRILFYQNNIIIRIIKYNKLIKMVPSKLLESLSKLASFIIEFLIASVSIFLCFKVDKKLALL